MPPPNLPLLLIVDDSEDDQQLLVLALKKAKFEAQVSTCWNGEAALEYLRSHQRKPDLIFLDVKMPIMNGLELLRLLKESQEWRSIPVCMLTTSNEPSDIRTAYQCYANAYIEKPVGLFELGKTVKLTSDFWFQCVTLP